MEVCKIHGGGTPSGIASPHFKHGRYSKNMPKGLSAKYEEAMKDPELLEMRNEIALVDARMSELLNMVDQGESGAMWAKLKRCYEAINKARSMGDQDELRDRMTELMQLIDKGSTSSATWDQIQNMMEQRRRLVESEGNRLVKMGQVLTYERAMILLAFVQDSIRRHVTDRAVLTLIAQDLRGIVATKSS